MNVRGRLTEVPHGDGKQDLANIDNKDPRKLRESQRKTCCQQCDRRKGCRGKLNKSGVENGVGQHTSGIARNHRTASKKSDTCEHRRAEAEGEVRVTKGPIGQIRRSSIGFSKCNPEKTRSSKQQCPDYVR